MLVITRWFPWPLTGEKSSGKMVGTSSADLDLFIAMFDYQSKNANGAVAAAIFSRLAITKSVAKNQQMLHEREVKGYEYL